uniref:Sphingomyelin phosphodiesterase C-terminal domain-containing protein n=1 Tax=Branchiostoma floridae TaxID=7739 RepID=C3ZKK0_BRAFL|eukprot:XP_002591088.1 hypothetical protein BRAFLDRAFT_69356 [Branchiostoma floridae]
MWRRCAWLAVVVALPVLALSDTGRFWFITDIHYDPSYLRPHQPGRVCDSLGPGMDPPANPGPWGDHDCDPPWRTINSSVYAMKAIDPNPDFILRGGDDVPHVDRASLNYTARTVVTLLSNITQLLEEVFPGVPVYSSLGGYYSAPLRAGLRVIGLNTNLLYGRNLVTEGQDDPAGQFAWLEQQLEQARGNMEKVYIIGHVPPGTHERIYTKRDFRPNHNKRYIAIVRKYADVISGQMFAHEHFDTFRMIYDEQGAPISTVFLSPAITPWMRRNNPAFRQYLYERTTGELQDYLQYYANLTKANDLQLTDLDWQLEYQATVDYGIPDVTPVSMETLRNSLNEVPSGAFEKYYKHNSVGVDYGLCVEDCRAAQLCSTYRVDYDEYDVCWQARVGGVRGHRADGVLNVLALAVMGVVRHLV